MDDLTLRLATESDINNCVNAFCLLLEETEKSENQDLLFVKDNVSLFKVILAESIRLFNICPVIAEIKGRKVGWNLIVKPSGFVTKNNSVQAMGSYVDPDFRGKGIATAMMEFAFDDLQSKNVDMVFGKFVTEKVTPERLGIEPYMVFHKKLKK